MDLIVLKGTGPPVSGRPGSSRILSHDFFPIKLFIRFPTPKMSPKDRPKRPNDAESDPKALQKGASDGHFSDFCHNGATLQKPQYYKWLSHILRIRGRPFFHYFSQKTDAGDGSSKKTSQIYVLTIFYRRILKIGSPRGGPREPANHTFRHFSLQGSPGAPQASPRSPKRPPGMIFG